MSRTIKAVERHMISQAKVLPVRLQREMHDALGRSTRTGF